VKSRVFSAVAGVFIVLMLTLMVIPLLFIVLRSWMP
jgi:hypothetical protein